MSRFAVQRLFNVRRDEVVPVLLAAAYFFCALTALSSSARSPSPSSSTRSSACW